MLMAEERMWTDAQVNAGHAMFVMVQMTGRCTSMHPFSALTAFVGCTLNIAEMLGVEGSQRLFAENLCQKMGYDYGRILQGLGEEMCRE
jgi:hypothetical protein